ncbi:MAG TPA: RICIN domain-containing protein [Streptomyces sp.]
MALASPALAQGQALQESDHEPLTPLSVSGASTYIDVGIRNYKSKKYLQPSDGSVAVGAKIVQYSFTGEIEQKWLWFDLGGRFTSFENRNSGLNLGIDGASTSDGAAAIQARGSGDFNQDWLVDWDAYGSNSVFALKNRNSGRCLGISNASTANNAQVVQFRCDGSLNQAWEGFPWGGAGA